MVSACSILMFLVMILSDRVDDVGVGVICMAVASLSRSRWSLEVFVMLLLALSPTIGQAEVVGMRIGIGWILVGRVPM